MLEDVVQVAEEGMKTRVPEEWRDMKMVMIPKPGNDQTAVKGWRPIVLANAVGKLAEKIIGQEVQLHEELWQNELPPGAKEGGRQIA